MTANRRILLNIVATYGRSLYALVIGLFCGRWTLMSLGQVDYGLMGLVGGLTGFVSFANMLLASAVGRFYAVSVGAAKKDGNQQTGLIECRRWFNTALSVHSVIPLVLLCIGYPFGLWMVEHFLTIPAARIGACVWVWRFTCLSCFIGMFSVPFQAMYTAKQEIAELTIYSFVTTTLNALFLYYMISHPGTWLVKFSFWTCLLSVLPQTIILIRAMFKFEECRFVKSYLWDMKRIKELIRFASACAISEIPSLLSSQGRSILVNKYMGPRYNASMAIGNMVAGQAMTLTGAVSGAMWPAIANKAGEGDHVKVKAMCFMYCRVGTVLTLLFALPLSLEAHEVLTLWLKDPPDFAAEICIAVLIAEVINKLTDGYWMALCSDTVGYVKYCHKMSVCGIVMLAVAWPMFAFGCGMWSICVGVICSALAKTWARLSSGQSCLSYTIKYWAGQVLVPIGFLIIVVLSVGCIPRSFMESSFVRVCLTTLVSEMALIPLVWCVVFRPEERGYFKNKLRNVKILRTL